MMTQFIKAHMRHNPADTLRNNDVVISSKRRNFDVITQNDILTL